MTYYKKKVKVTFKIRKIAKSINPEIRAFEKKIKDLNRTIEQLVIIISVCHCLSSVPDIGKVYAAGVIAEIDRIERFID